MGRPRGMGVGVKGPKQRRIAVVPVSLLGRTATFMRRPTCLWFRATPRLLGGGAPID